MTNNNNNNNNKSNVTLDNKKNKGKKLLSIKFENKKRIWSKVYKQTLKYAMNCD